MFFTIINKKELLKFAGKIGGDIGDLQGKIIILNTKTKSIEDNLKNLYKSNESYKDCIEELQDKNKEMQEMLKQHEETIEGLIEVLKSDRRDLNAIINIIKKLDKPTTKGKK